MAERRDGQKTDGALLGETLMSSLGAIAPAAPTIGSASAMGGNQPLLAKLSAKVFQAGIPTGEERRFTHLS